MTVSGVNTPLRKQFGLKVKELRQAGGMSQEAFADRCGFARSYMSRVERGGANPSLDAVEVLATALGVEVKQLFDAPTTTAVDVKKQSPRKIVPR
jgi:transcriptional regulator with XRE-family HTH domain